MQTLTKNVYFSTEDGIKKSLIFDRGFADYFVILHEIFYIEEISLKYFLSVE